MTNATAATAAMGGQLMERVRAARSLPSPPVVTARLIELGEDPDVGLAELIDVLRSDPVITARILRLANSPLYARRRRADNLHQAVVALGLDAVFTAALSVSLVGSSGAFGRPGPMLRHTWSRSVHSAVVAQLLAGHCGGTTPGTAFLAALVQDIGILVLGELEPTLYASLPSTSTHMEFVEVEVRELGVDHAAVGAVLLEEWRLPDEIVTAVAGSHVGGRSGRGPDRLTDIVAVAGLVADGLLGADRSFVAASGAAERLLGVDAFEFSRLIDAAVESLPELAPMLDVEAPSPDVLAERAAEAMIARQMQQRHAIERLQDDLAGVSEVARQLEVAGRSDLLTGLLNRGYFEATLEREFDRARRHGDGVSVLFLDLDDFRDTNTEFGHLGGDAVLRTAADRIVAALRDDDVVARFGGDEFVVLLPATQGWQAEIVARRLVAAISSRPIEVEPTIEYVQTATVGVAAFDDLPHVGSAEELLRAADEALYTAKSAGKNSWYRATG